jgi:hypothetical protein
VRLLRRGVYLELVEGLLAMTVKVWALGHLLILFWPGSKSDFFSVSRAEDAGTFVYEELK